MNNTNPIVSIIIPTYNNAKTIVRTIDSCINQTYKNLEIIVIDDGSTDNTKDVLRKYNTDKRFKYIYQENKERSAARNHGLDVSKGEYIQFLDSDDVIYPTKIDKQVNLLDANPEYFLVYCGVKYKNEIGQTTHVLEPKIDGNIDYEILKGNFITIHSPLFRKTNIKFDTKINRLEDWKFWIYVVKDKEIAYIDEILCDVNIHENTHFSKTYKINMLIGAINLYTDLRKDIASFSNNKFLLFYFQFKNVIYLIYTIFFK